MNVCAECFNRPIQEQFVDYHEDQLFHDLPGFNRKLADWMVDCNTVLLHHSLSACNLLQLPHPQSTRAPKVVDLYKTLF
ncbi:hypothetical protein [Candidatus Spongiihabitans sp.]|uniref:hypothetical protein n=1 Tax=Candidatus Spongiihabitans sp. TaxID=3101308 RepID=UPI003C6FAD8F